MYTAQAYRHYATTQAQTADRGELVVMLYEGALKFLSRAVAALQAGNLEEAHNSLVRCQDIVAELMGSLNMEAGEIAFNLLRIYEYMHRRLVDANLGKDERAVREVAGLLRDLLPAWQEAARRVRTLSLPEREARAGKPCYAAL